jgi:hypothetical protein
VKYVFCSVSTPAHAWSVEANANQLADCSLDDSGSDGKVVTTKCLVAQTTAVACQVVDDVAETLPTALVAWASLGNAEEGSVEVLQHSVNPAATQQGLLFGNPLSKLG